MILNGMILGTSSYYWIPFDLVCYIFGINVGKPTDKLKLIIAHMLSQEGVF